MATNNQINVPTPFAINKGGTGVTSVTTAPTASAWAGWDANKNLSANSHIEGYATTVTAAGTTTLTVGSTWQQFFTGSTTQTVTLPVTSTLVLGQSFYIVNNSSGNVTVNSSGGNAIQVMTASTTLLVTCILTSGTTAASWATEYVGAASGGTVSNGTINQLAWYAATGTTVSGLTIVNSAGLLTSAGGVPGWVAYTGTGAPVLGTAPTISAPKIDQINDQTNNSKVLSFTAPASAVNFFNMVSAITGTPVSLNITGSDANVNCNITLKGIGALAFFSNGQQTLGISAGSASAVNSIQISNSLTNVAPALGVSGSDTNISLNLNSKGTGRAAIQGISTNTAAAAGYVGEFITSTVASASAVTSSSNVASNVTTISLTAGDWDVYGNVTWITMGTVPTQAYAWTSATSATLPDFNITSSIAVSSGLTTRTGLCAPYQRYLLSTTTTIYLSGYLANTSGAGTFCGSIYARRRS